MSKDKADKRESSSSEYTSTSSEYEEPEQQPASLFGNSRTRLRWQPSTRTMNIDVRQTLQNRRNLEVSYKGRLNTTSGEYHHIIRLKKNMHQGTPSLARIIAAERGIELEGADSINPDKFLPAGLSTLLLKDWSLSPGIKFEQIRPPSTSSSSAAAAGGSINNLSSESSDFKYCVTLRKQPQVLHRRGVWDSWLSGKADLQFDAASQAVAVAGNVRLKVFRMNVTDKQDVQLAAGYDYTLGNSSKSLTPYVRFGENNWSVRLQKGLWSFNYEM